MRTVADKREANLFREAISKLMDREVAMLHYYLSVSVLMTGDGNCENMVAVEAEAGNALAKEAMAVRAKVINYQRRDMRR